MANLMVHQTIPYWQVYSENFGAFQRANLHTPGERVTANNIFMTFHDIGTTMQTGLTVSTYKKHQKATLIKALYVTPDQWQHADVHIDLEATQGT